MMANIWSYTYWITPVVVLLIVIWRLFLWRRARREHMRRQQEYNQANQTNQNNQVFVVQPGNP